MRYTHGTLCHSRTKDKRPYSRGNVRAWPGNVHPVVWYFTEYFMPERGGSLRVLQLWHSEVSVQAGGWEWLLLITVPTRRLSTYLVQRDPHAAELPERCGRHSGE